jgi:hypothetical protein
MKFKKILKFVIFFLPVVPLLFFLVHLTKTSSIWGLSGDPEQFIWQAFNWKQFFTSGNSLLTNSYFGLPTPLTFTPTVFIQSLIFLFFNFFFRDQIFSYNSMVAMLFVTNYFSWFYFFRRIKINYFQAIVGGIFIALAPSTILHSMQHMGVFITFPFALLLIALESAKTNPAKILNWVLIGLALGFCFWGHEYWGVAALLIFTLFLVYNYSKLINLKKLLITLSSFIFVSTPIWLVYLQQYIYQFSHQLTQRRSITEAASYSTGPIYYFLPAFQIESSEKYNYLGIINICFLGTSLIYFIIRKKIKLTEYHLIAFLFFFLSLGTRLEILNFHIYLPSAVLYKLNFPLIAQIRAWGRFGILVYIPITILFFKEINESLKTNTKLKCLVPFCFLVIFVFDVARLKLFYTTQIRLSPAINLIKSDAKSSFVIHVPFNITLGGLHNSSALLWQTYHGHPLVNGYTSFGNPDIEKKISKSVVNRLEYRALLADNSNWTKETCNLFKDDLKKEEIGYLVWEKDSNFYYDGRYTKVEESKVNNKLEEIFKCFRGNIIESNDKETVAKI